MSRPRSKSTLILTTPFETNSNTDVAFIKLAPNGFRQRRVNTLDVSMCNFKTIVTLFQNLQRV